MQEDPAEWAQVDVQDELSSTGENMSYLAQTTEAVTTLRETTVFACLRIINCP